MDTFDASIAAALLREDAYAAFSELWNKNDLRAMPEEMRVALSCNRSLHLLAQRALQSRGLTNVSLEDARYFVQSYLAVVNPEFREGHTAEMSMTAYLLIDQLDIYWTNDNVAMRWAAFITAYKRTAVLTLALTLPHHIMHMVRRAVADEMPNDYLTGMIEVLNQQIPDHRNHNALVLITAFHDGTTYEQAIACLADEDTMEHLASRLSTISGLGT